MGYYTYHTLETQPETYDVDHEQQISALTGYGSCFEDEIKWYDHEQDMRTYSKRYPEVLFVLRGAGEDSGDLWVEYYRNGKMQRCSAMIVYPPFDESELL